MWIYDNNPIKELPEDCIGFVYLITNNTNGRMYIGKKLAKFKRSRPPLKGRKNKRRLLKVTGKITMDQVTCLRKM